MGIIIRQSIKGTIVTYAGSFLGFITTMLIATRWLTEEEIGLARVLLEAATLLSYLAQLGITNSAVRFFPRFKAMGARRGGFFFYLMVIPLVGTLVAIPLYLLFRGPIAAYFQERSALFVGYVDWIIPLMFFLTYIAVFEIYANLLMRIVIPRFVREILIRVLVAGVYILYGTRVINLEGFVIAYVLVHGIAMLVNFWYITRLGALSWRPERQAITADTRREYLRYTAYLMLGVIGGGIAARLDIFMISGMQGLAAGGIYSIAFYMAAIIEIPSRSITAISTPVAADALQAKNFAKANELYKKVSLHQLIIGGLVLLLLWANIDNIYAIIPRGDTFRHGKWVVLLVALSRVIVLFLGFGYTLLSFSRHYRWALAFTFITVAITLLANYLLIPPLGITGAALATLLATVITYALQQWLVFKRLKANPYTRQTARCLLLLLALFGLNYILPRLENPWLDAITRTTILAIAALFTIPFARLSSELDHITCQARRHLKTKPPRRD
ncbi:MAG: polysaccharide biosynthesis C-terminal domain-containing protein [Odoribacteraceae bacterium]|jgi:O-antigen/teichoic acid export membrane protein|nr:polysaccharide biosynthesis C-terminal domain-containing protein [Odoribacteraceae bacterium]